MENDVRGRKVFAYEMSIHSNISINNISVYWITHTLAHFTHLYIGIHKSVHLRNWIRYASNVHNTRK